MQNQSLASSNEARKVYGLPASSRNTISPRVTRIRTTDFTAPERYSYFAINFKDDVRTRPQ
jgi:hypothetical protein